MVGLASFRVKPMTGGCGTITIMVVQTEGREHGRSAVHIDRIWDFESLNNKTNLVAEDGDVSTARKKMGEKTRTKNLMNKQVRQPRTKGGCVSSLTMDEILFVFLLA
jgi:hypothetical protein